MRTDTGGPALRVRAATAADLEAIAALHTAARAAYQHGRAPGSPFDTPAEHARLRAAWGRVLDRGDTSALCAERDGTVIGAASYHRGAGSHTPRPPESAEPAGRQALTPGGATVTLHQLHVDPGHWGTGVGRALHTACLHAWRTAGCSRAVLDVLWHNHRARAFYAALGWQPDPGRRPAPDATHLTLLLPLVPRTDPPPAGR
ncbi:GNAT family N-acetyltransferase [Streptomyces sp. NPDC101393]|uniref:GNAT family N-acetyltransferase n=1 Tax=Streptomyces sp. NPDC101393 TaxID=3366141 RepID=UPI00381BB1C7